MRKLHSNMGALLLGTAAFLFSACDDYLDDIPKGEKIPTTWEDYNAFIRNNQTYHYFDTDQQAILIGDMFKSPTSVSSKSLTRTHYFCDESVNRVEVMDSEGAPYYSAYEGIFAWNLIVENVPNATECTPQQRDMLIAQGRTLRAMHYYYLTNYYADQYTEETKDKLSVPMVTSSSVEASSPQVSLQKMYEFILDDLNKAVNDLPQEAETILHPNKATGYGMLARVYLSMGNYDKALENASLALEQNNRLFNWVEYYNNDKERFDDPTNYDKTVPGNMETENVENYIYTLGSQSGWQGIDNTVYALLPERAARFEEGDTRLLTHWKHRVSSSGIPYFSGIYAEEINHGMRSPEMYYVKAECLARKGGAENIKAAMDLVNQVRKTRILPEVYKDLTATTTKEAVEKIIDCKLNEFVQNQVAFCDLRRLNKDPEYARTITKKVSDNSGEQTVTLTPDSHLWIMPFSNKIISNPGNGTITQNTPR